MPIADDDKRRVLDATDLVSLVGETVALKPKGREFVGLCPFHDDRNPSMYVVPHKQIFHCFVCGAGGDALTYTMRYHGMEFPEALRHLAERSGVELTPWKPDRQGPGAGRRAGDSPGRSTSRNELIDVLQRAAAFYRGILNHEEHGAAAREIIERRGISDEMVEAFALGAAPDRWDGLVAWAESKSIPEPALIDAGLVKQRETGGVYDALRNRLVFPIRDEAARVIAFGGRKINEEDEPKYLNSPETAVFHKSRTLYGMDLARSAIRAKKQAVIVEGYTDVIACHQGGFRNVIGTLGTALTPEHARRLRGHADEIVLLFDGDEAGQRAADRAFQVLFGASVDVRVAMLGGPSGENSGVKDPDELLKTEGGAERFQQLLESAPHIIDFWAARLRSGLSTAGPAARTRRIREEVDRLRSLGLQTLPRMERRLILERLAEASGTDIATIAEAAAERGRAPRGGPMPEQTAPVERLEDEPRMARVLLATALERPDAAVEHAARLGPLLERLPFRGRSVRAVAALTADFILRGDEPTSQDLLIELTDEPARAAVAALLAEAYRETGGDSKLAAGLLTDCLTRLELASREGPAGGAGSIPPSDPSGDSFDPSLEGDPFGGLPIEAPSELPIDDPGTEMLPTDPLPDHDQHADHQSGQPQIETLAERLERLRRVHKDLGGNPEANPYARGDG